MLAHGLPILATLALWWASTGLILLLDGLDRKTFGPSMVGASAALAVAIWSRCRQRAPGDVGSSLCRLRLRPRRLGMAAPEFLHRRSHRAAQERLPAGMPRVRAVRRGCARQPLSRTGGGARRCCPLRLDLWKAQPIGSLDLRHPLVDASEREAQCLLRRSEPSARRCCRTILPISTSFMRRRPMNSVLSGLCHRSRPS